MSGVLSFSRRTEVAPMRSGRKWPEGAPGALGSAIGADVVRLHHLAPARVVTAHGLAELLRRAAAGLIALLGDARAHGLVLDRLVERRVQLPHDLRRQAGRTEQPDPGGEDEVLDPGLGG